MKYTWSSLRITAALVLIGSYGIAQNITGSMTGRVTDRSGSVIVNATVTVTEIAQNLAVKRQTSADGNFTLAGLMPGTYTIKKPQKYFLTVTWLSCIYR